MEFTIETTYGSVDDYGCLSEFGHYVKEEFVPRYEFGIGENGRRIRIETGIRSVRTHKIVLNGATDFLRLVRLLDEDVIIRKDKVLEIYNSYRE